MADEKRNIIVRVSPKIHSEFKKLCIDKSTTMQELITDFIKNELAKKGDK